MPAPKLTHIGFALTLVLGAVAVLFFFRYQDPMLLIFGIQAIFLTWLVVFIVHVLKRGIPVRIVGDEKKGP